MAVCHDGVVADPELHGAVAAAGLHELARPRATPTRGNACASPTAGETSPRRRNTPTAPTPGHAAQASDGAPSEQSVDVLTDRVIC
jgi:hypothetical protein